MSFGKFLKKAIPAALGIAALVGTGGTIAPALSKFVGSAAFKKIGLPALATIAGGLLASRENKQDTKPYYSPSDIKNKNIFGGSRFIDDRFRGLNFDQKSGKFFDEMDFDNQTFRNFMANEQGEIIDPVTGEPITGPQGGEIDPENLNMGGIAMLPNYNTGNIQDMNEAMQFLATGGDTFPRKLGQITGPGGPKEDKVPAMLSAGEFVFTAKAVDNAGGPKAMYNLMNKLDPESSKGRGIMS